MYTTAVVCVVAMVSLAIFDLVMSQIYGVNGTISRVLQRTAFGHPAFSFAIGFICGHIFGYMKPETVVKNFDIFLDFLFATVYNG